VRSSQPSSRPVADTAGYPVLAVRAFTLPSPHVGTPELGIGGADLSSLRRAQGHVPVRARGTVYVSVESERYNYLELAMTEPFTPHRVILWRTRFRTDLNFLELPVTLRYQENVLAASTMPAAAAEPCAESAALAPCGCQHPALPLGARPPRHQATVHHNPRHNRSCSFGNVCRTTEPLHG